MAPPPCRGSTSRHQDASTSITAAKHQPAPHPSSSPGAGKVDRSTAFLPAPAVQNHAANLAVLPGGDLGCVWFGGTQECVQDISIWFSRLSGDAWSPPTTLFPATTTGGVFVRQPPVVLASGRWLVPVFHWQAIKYVRVSGT